MDGLIYLLHFARPISERHTCQHYLGWCLDLNERLAAHRAGHGSRLTQVAVERGIGFEVVRTWVGSRDFERHLKNRKQGPRLCPMCSPTRRPCQPQSDVVQLELPIDDFPEPPRLAMDSYEFLTIRRWRQASAVPVGGCTDFGTDDIPY